MTRTQREQARRVYAQAARLESRLGAADARPRLAELRRVVQRLVDLVLEDGTTLVGLTCVKALRAPGGDPVPTHGANVAVLALLLGERAGLGRNELVEVGLAALAQDAGSGTVADPTVRALRGAALLLQLGPLESVARAALAAVEQHAHEEAPGRLVAAESRDLVTSIIHVARTYDALTAAGGTGSRPDRALATLLESGGAPLERTLVKLLAHALGIYPPGTVVRLAGGEVGVVLRGNRDPELLDRPRVRLLHDPAGQPLAGSPLVDLAERDGHGFVRSIAAALDPEPLGIVPAAIFTGTL